MTEQQKQHEGLPVMGYKPQPDAKVQVVNVNKQMEERLLRRIKELESAKDGVEVRWLRIATTHFEEGFMALNRAIFQPERIPLPEDPPPQQEPAKEKPLPATIGKEWQP